MKQWTRIIAAKPGRAWNNKLDKINDLFSWMYNKDILSPREKQTKDSLFGSYYRYYNDGEFPSRLRKYDLHKYSNPKQIEEALEKEVEEFIIKILSKYAGTYDRSEFHYDMLVKKLNDAIEELNPQSFGTHSIKYFVNKIPRLDEEINSYLEQLQTLSQSFNEDINKIKSQVNDDNNKLYLSDSSGESNRISTLKELGLLTPEIESKYKEMAQIVIKIRTKLRNVLTAAEEARSLKLI